MRRDLSALIKSILSLGFDVLTAIEKLPVDGKEKPTQDIILKTVTIFVDPFQEVDDFLKDERKLEEKVEPKMDKRTDVPQQRSGVGSFVDLSQIMYPTSASNEDDKCGSSKTDPGHSSKWKKTKSSSSFGNFSNW